MGLSLREKLKNAGMAPKERPKAPPKQDCFCRVQRFPAEEMALPQIVDAEALIRIDGKDWQETGREAFLFLDTETTGLSGGAGTVAFLVGLGYFEGGEYVLEQYVMRDYDEEPFLLEHVAGRLREHPIPCTYNGASFDLPLLRSRCIMWRKRLPESGMQLDLLYPSRRIWKLRLGKCNLTHVEEEILHLRREDDLPGSQVPERFFRYLKEQDFALLEDVLRHNAQDICSLPVILERLADAHLHPTDAMSEAEDLYSMGRVMEKRGRGDVARRCYRASDRGRMASLARLRLGELERRSGRYDEAARQFERALTLRRSAEIHIAAAKVYEHRLKNSAKALEHVRRAMLLCDHLSPAEQDKIMRRFRRLMKKTRRQTNNGIPGFVESSQRADEASEREE